MPKINWLPSLCAALLVSGGAVVSNGCTDVVCGDGTRAMDGKCVPADIMVGDATCGAGTKLEDGECRPVYEPTVCDEASTIPELDPETGVTTCRGTGGPGGCMGDLACPSAAANKVTVCGRLHNVQDGSMLYDEGATGIDCTNPEVSDSAACRLEISFYDALDFAGNPTGAQRLAVEEFYQDDCGRYIARNITTPGLGFMGIGVDDKTSAPDVHRLTGVAFPVQAGARRARQKTYVITQALNQMWTTTSGISGASFVDRGVFMGLFEYPGTTPRAGVTLTVAGNTRPNDDYYFTDTDPTERTTVTPNGPTGPNGAGLMINTGLLEHSGTGGDLPAGCNWESALAAAIPGVLFVSPRHPLNAQGTVCN